MKTLDSSKVYLVTGAGGFIGFYLSKRLLDAGARVIGYDNMNNYYDVSLKEDRLKILVENGGDRFTFIRGNIADKDLVFKTFEDYKPDIVVNLAAQAGVRYSIENPAAYVESNLVGFFNILEACRNYPVEHLVYASSSSVYGGNRKVPFSTDDKVDHPVSFYAATKKSNELMAYSYSKLYGIKSTGLRFFTVYGPYGRPDMAAFLFANAIMKDEPIKVFNNGDMKRDFTYIDDIIEGLINVLPNAPKEDENGVNYKVYNIGNNEPQDLMTFISTIEKALGKEAKKVLLPMQPGDVKVTYADVTDLMNDFGFKPSTSIEEGIGKFAKWFKEYYGQK